MLPFGYRTLLAFALLLAAASIFLSAFLFTRLSDQQDALRRSDKNICLVQGTAYAGILANLGLSAQRAVVFSKKARDPFVRSYYAQEARAESVTLDGLFKKPPRCGQAFTFTIQIEGQKKRTVKTAPSP